MVAEIATQKAPELNWLYKLLRDKQFKYTYHDLKGQPDLNKKYIIPARISV